MKIIIDGARTIDVKSVVIVCGDDPVATAIQHDDGTIIVADAVRDKQDFADSLHALGLSSSVTIPANPNTELSKHG